MIGIKENRIAGVTLVWLLSNVKRGEGLPPKGRARSEALTEVAERSLNKLLTENLDCSGGLPDF